MPETVSATQIKAAESVVRRNKIEKDNVPIIPNDRDIPAFIEDNDSEEQYNCCKTNRSLQSRQEIYKCLFFTVFE